VKRKWEIGLEDWQFRGWSIWDVRGILLDKRRFVKEEMGTDEKSGFVGGHFFNGNIFLSFSSSAR
jgi:hypothetical protein